MLPYKVYYIIYLFDANMVGIMVRLSSMVMYLKLEIDRYYHQLVGKLCNPFPFYLVYNDPTMTIIRTIFKTIKWEIISLSFKFSIYDRCPRMLRML